MHYNVSLRQKIFKLLECARLIQGLKISHALPLLLAVRTAKKPRKLQKPLKIVHIQSTPRFSSNEMAE